MNSMTDTTFKTWLIQPGNHRRLQTIRRKMSVILGETVEVTSWSDLYRLFEIAMTRDDGHRQWFEPIFEQIPPSEAWGATARQVRLYRGARLSGEADSSRQEGPDRTITYRGRVVRQSGGNAEDNEPTSARARYYRGAKVDSD